MTETEEAKENHKANESVSRRKFLGKGLLGLGSLSGAAVFGIPRIASCMGPKPVQAPPQKPKSKYATPTFVAFIDTIIPGKESDPTQAPGAIEADTFEYLERVEKSKIFPISIDLIHFAVTQALDTASWFSRFVPFNNLALKDRQGMIEKLLFIPGIPFLLRLARAPFYTAAVNRVGFDYLGYPGPNEGYSDYSFREVLAKPEAGTVGGNLS